MNIANKLTVSRVIMVPFFMFFILRGYEIIGFSIFVLACITDWLDGYIARKYNLISNFGKFADPLADKLLVCAALICFVELGKVASYAAWIIIAREFMVTGLRLAAVAENIVIAADKIAKYKTVFQMIAMLLLCIDKNVTPYNFYSITNWVLIISVILTIVSGINYFAKNATVLLKSENI